MAVRGIDARLIQLNFKRFRKVQERFSRPAVHRNRQTTTGILLFEKLGDLLSHFEAAGSNSRPDRRNQFCGIAAENLRHLQNSFLQDARKRSLPAGVNDRRNSTFRIRHQDWKAIGCLDGYGQSPDLGNQRIPFSLVSLFLRFLYYVNSIGMNLLQGSERRPTQIQRIQKTPPVGPDPFRRIPMRAAQV